MGHRLELANPTLLKPNQSHPGGISLQAQIRPELWPGPLNSSGGTQHSAQRGSDQRREPRQGITPQVNGQAHGLALQRQRPLGRQIGGVKGLQTQGRGTPRQAGANRAEQRVIRLLELQSKLGLTPLAKLLQLQLQRVRGAQGRPPNLTLTGTQDDAFAAELQPWPEGTASHQLPAALTQHQPFQSSGEAPLVAQQRLGLDLRGLGPLPLATQVQLELVQGSSEVRPQAMAGLGLTGLELQRELIGAGTKQRQRPLHTPAPATPLQG